jgi:hypothetical protein
VRDTVSALRSLGFEIRADGDTVCLRYRGMGMPRTLELGRLLDQAHRQRTRLLERLYVQAQAAVDAQGAGWA